MDVIDRFERFYQHLGQDSADQLADVYSERIVFIDPIARHEGLPALRTYFENLLQNCRSCRFKMTVHRIDGRLAFVVWTMTFKHARLRGGEPIAVDGVSHLTIDGDAILLQRDYYDMGAMVYENVPMLGLVVSGLRRRMMA